MYTPGFRPGGCPLKLDRPARWRPAGALARPAGTHSRAHTRTSTSVSRRARRSIASAPPKASCRYALAARRCSKRRERCCRSSYPRRQRHRLSQGLGSRARRTRDAAGGGHSCRGRSRLARWPAALLRGGHAVGLHVVSSAVDRIAAAEPSTASALCGASRRKSLGWTAVVDSRPSSVAGDRQGRLARGPVASKVKWSGRDRFVAQPRAHAVFRPPWRFRLEASQSFCSKRGWGRTVVFS